MKRAVAGYAEEITLVLLALALNGCTLLRSSDRTFLSNAEASWIYYDGKYVQECVAVAGPATCKGRKAGIVAADAELKLSTLVVAKGQMPSEERTAIRKALKKAKTGK